jgi:hypothetical protein
MARQQKTSFIGSLLINNYCLHNYCACLFHGFMVTMGRMGNMVGSYTQPYPQQGILSKGKGSEKLTSLYFRAAALNT